MLASARRLAPDAALVTVIAVFTAVVSQRWTGLFLDSMFYGSLSLFGDDVTDRAVIPSYYGTRLGYIVPVRVLTGALGTWAGFEAYRFLLILIIVAGLYVTARRFTTRVAAGSLAAMLVLNTVVLSYVGNPYVTGTVLAGTAVVIACSLFDDWRAQAVAGVALGWLAMAHPPGVLLAGSVWAAMAIHRRPSFRAICAAAVGAAVTFGVFLVAGRLIFPTMNWFDTYITWNAKLNYSDFASKEPIWLHDVALLVPLMALVISAGVWAIRRDRRWAQNALIVNLTSIGFMLVFNQIMGGVALEAPMYQAAMWMPALASLALVGAGLLEDAPTGPGFLVAAGAAIVASILCGRWVVELPGALAMVLALLGSIAVVAAAWVQPRLSRSIGSLVVIIALAAALCGAQLIQDSRRTIGLYPFTPYSNAFAANPFSAKMHAAVNAERWLLDNTSSSDKILNWVDGDWVAGDRELYMVAGMQLWGENRVTLERSVGPADAAQLATLRPTVISMVGPTTDGILRFWASLPSQAHATAPQCYDFPWPSEEFSVGHSCLTRLKW